MTTETTQPNLPAALRDMANGCKPIGNVWDAPELMRIAAAEIERLEEVIQELRNNFV